jgi:Zn-dependent protease
MMNPATIAGIASIAIVSITSHEAAHGFVADRLGDPTARERGRLTLNPIPHIDLFFTILLPLVLILSGTGIVFGGAKPVPVDVSRLRNPRRDWALVGAAGPAMNVAIAVGLAIVLSVLTHLGGLGESSGVTEVLAAGIFINTLLAVFNLLPIPPLDGSRVVQYLLSGEALAFYRRLDRIGLLIVVALVFFVRPVQELIVDGIFGLTNLITLPFGVWTDVQPLLGRILLH